MKKYILTSLLIITTLVFCFPQTQANIKFEPSTKIPATSLVTCLGSHQPVWFTATFAYDSILWEDDKTKQPLTKKDTLFLTPNLVKEINTIYYFNLHVFTNNTKITKTLLVVANSPFEFYISSDTTICFGDTTKIVAYNPKNEILSYKWASDVNSFMPPTGSTITEIDALKPGKYWVEATNQNRTCSQIDTFELTVINQSVNIGNDRSACSTDGLILENLTSVQSGYTYTWFYDNKSVSTPTIQPTTSNKYTLRLTSPAPENCIFEDSAYITINEAPKINLTPSGSICNGQTYIIQNQLANSGISYTTTWESTTSLPPNISVGQEYITVTNPGTYTLTLSTPFCSSKDSTRVDVLSFEVDLGNNISDTCTNTGVTLFNTKSNTEQSASFYLWRWNGGTSTKNSITATTPGMYHLTVTSNSPECEVSDSVYIGINLIPVFTLGDDVISKNTFFTFDATFEGKFPATDFNFIWKIADTIFSTNSRLLIEQPGTHEIFLTIENINSQCKSSDLVKVLLPEEPIEALHVVYIPDAISQNSTYEENSKLKVLGPDIANESFEFKLYNRWGQIIFESSDFDYMNTIGWDGNGETNQSPNGTYTFTARGKFIDGTNFEEIGTVTVLR